MKYLKFHVVVVCCFFFSFLFEYCEQEKVIENWGKKTFLTSKIPK